MIGISGCTGFIGRRLAASFVADGIPWIGLSRRPSCNENFRLIGLEDTDNLVPVLAGLSAIFHCAGYAHAFSSPSAGDANSHWMVNFQGARNLVEAAGMAGVRCFVFLSSVKAMAESGTVCAEEDFPGEPETAYGQAKRAAEAAVLEAGRRYGMHVVNLRLAMVYGSGGRGNLERMGRLVQRGLFPPLPETRNHRSLVHVDDVVAVMRLVADDERANGQTYIVASQSAPSGRELFDAMREVQGMPACRWTVPEVVLRLAGYLGDGVEHLSRRRMPMDSEVVMRLLDSAWYSPARIERELGWRAQVVLADGLREMLRR
jgi:UDP-glucose 4-epimerase